MEKNNLKTGKKNLKYEKKNFSVFWDNKLFLKLIKNKKFKNCLYTFI